MSDKSFGDQPTRNIIKNPLLSTAVTGLSIEDLTQNAVLLPVSQAQRLLLAQDEQTRTDTTTLRHLEHDTQNQPSGDTNTHISNTLPNVNLNTLDSQKNVTNNEKLTTHTNVKTTKTDDDFDVNEYFARLHGTRYVSAPLNVYKDDNANLEATEENLEEINLNEPDKIHEDVQQSLTADIAQNFSQLPTVLPQVASAVFSSFSNMLNIKSKDQLEEPTPVSDIGHQHVQFQMPEDIGVPLMSVSESVVKEIAPPPKEPPMGGAGHYRITSKKKTYAQIPGLRSGDTGQNVFQYQPGVEYNTPSYFTPSTSNTNVKPTEVYKSTFDYASNIQQNVSIYDFNQFDKAQKGCVNSGIATPEKQTETPKGSQKLNPLDIQSSFTNTEATHSSLFKPTTVKDFKSETSSINVAPDDLPQYQHIAMPPNLSSSQGSNAQIIPPPPMFCNVPRKVSLTDNRKCLLPPSIARRIVVNQPVVKTHVQHSSITTNIFTPTLIPGNFTDRPESKSGTERSQENKLTEADDSKTVPLTISTSSTIPASTEIYDSLPGTTKTISDLQNEFNIRYSNQINLLSPQSNQSLTSNKIEPENNLVIRRPITTMEPKSLPVNLPSSSMLTNLGSSQLQIHPSVTQKPPKPLLEPPKISGGNINYRLTKKRPQYYSGPIAGVGCINNNFKPVIAPVETNTFQDELFTSNPREQFIDQNIPAVQEHSSVPLSLNRSTNNAEVSFDLNSHKYEQKSVQPDYSTIFDFSRQTSEKYDPTPQESKGFGIIGSLKSKLSSFDINRIQNSVTTFFDPNYTEASKANIDDIYKPQEYCEQNLPSEQRSQGSHFEICVPNVVQDTSFINQQAQSQIYDYGHISQQYHYQTNKNQILPHSYTFSSYYSTQDSIVTTNDNNVCNKEKGQEMHSEVSSTINQSISNQSQHKSIDNQQYLFPVGSSNNHDYKFETTDPEIIRLNKKNSDCTASQNVTHSFTPSMGNRAASQEIYSFFDKNIEPENIDIFKDTDNTARNFSTNNKTTTENVTTDNDCEELEKLQEDIKYITLAEKSEIYDEIGTQENASDLNICETCREVNKFEEDRETDDLTAQLIENITSPIQLLNPVEVPFTESNITDDRDIFDSEQCSEISHITEQTIETIQNQSASELLEDSKESNRREYGWYTDNSTYPHLRQMTMLEPKYDFIPDCSSIGFYGNNSLFFDNESNSTIDEIKSGFKCSTDNTEILLTRQMNIPSAPPVEAFEDKSEDIGCLDVQSIEQDAKKDYPCFEEFVIEPSETDDDKIEFVDHIKPSDIQDVDSFTNRIEKAKKFEEISNISVDRKKSLLVNTNLHLFNMPYTVSHPVTFASYFDTGNYAVETHFKNSYSSPSIYMSTITIPPGFEKAYRRKSSGIIDRFLSNNVTMIPDTTTQTRISPTLTYGIAENMEVNVTQMVTNVVECLRESSPQRTSEYKTLPLFSTAFDTDDDEPINITPENIVKEVLSDSPKCTTLLTDPINFFSQSTKTDGNINPPDDSFNRLASYFVSPIKPDNSKPFFELSQSQDHYRQTIDNQIRKQSLNVDKREHKSFFELGQSQNHLKDAHKSAPDKYTANLQLIKDLTNCQNMELKNEQVVKTVNYFTMEYDRNVKKEKVKRYTDNVINYKNSVLDICDRMSISMDQYITALDLMHYLTNYNVYCKKDRLVNCFTAEIAFANSQLDEGEKLHHNSKHIDNVKVNNCKYCCNLGLGPLNKDTGFECTCKNFKVRQVMDGNSHKKDNDKSVNKNNADENKTSVNVNLEDNCMHEESNEGVISENRSAMPYVPVKYHWFYRVESDSKSIWRGFSVTDSRALEEAYLSPDLNEQTLVPTDGGRFDVNIMGRMRIPVYWSDTPNSVIRCSWFYRSSAARYVPYSEEIAAILENEYRRGVSMDVWHRRVTLPNNEMVVMHSASNIMHYLFCDDVDSACDTMSQQRRVRREYDESEIEESEPSSIDHLLLLCHGVGAACDLSFRSVDQVVDDFRTMCVQLLQSHYRNSYDNGVVGRIEVLPISWHAELHSGELDQRLSQITLDSIPRLRSFSNDTILDVLFYTSPVFCQTIIDTVASELNRIYALFCLRNPGFKGGVSVGGHSLGSVVLYDLLCHQTAGCSLSTSEKTYVRGRTGSGESGVNYPQLTFAPHALYALGSPIALFECVRGVESLGERFALPTCPKFFNIFHPNDPIAYRIEPLINSNLKNVKPFLIPHHKGRKRMHLELKETMVRVGADLKQRLVESLRNTLLHVWKPLPAPPDRQLEKVVEEDLEKELRDEAKEDSANADEPSEDMLGKLNSGRRIDYVLQEAPLEILNEYLSAIRSHLCYWDSEDTMLLILKEIYDAIGVPPDSTVPQQSMTVQRTRVTTNDDSNSDNFPDYPSTSYEGMR